MNDGNCNPRAQDTIYHYYITRLSFSRISPASFPKSTTPTTDESRMLWDQNLRVLCSGLPQGFLDFGVVAV